MRIVVLGGRGQIGSRLMEGLKNRHLVIGTSRQPSQDLVAFDPHRDNWEVLGHADAVINCIGQILPTQESSFHRAHVGLTESILKNRERIGNPLIVQISALGASPRHGNEFLRTKGIADDLLLSQPRTFIVRPSIVCTPGTMIVKKLLTLSRVSRILRGYVPVPRGFLQTRIQPIMPEDLVDIIHRMCEDQQFRAVNAVGPDAISFGGLIEIMTKAIHRKMCTIEVSRTITDVAVRSLFSRLRPNVISPQQYDLLFEDNIANPSIAREILGRELTPVTGYFHNEFAHASD